MFPFDPPENIREPKGILGRKGLTPNSKTITHNRITEKIVVRKDLKQ